ncbi:uncharacterized protein TrAFT101_006402 [Trichoderma asperellum]|uniref:NmrA-like domain-containing protein n=1 Tax=Trichoderma asperellum (strain ATCC 204424 / CBS 433.97 / NBRC 101777) TaxID=1042311 RepID=A0A2T3YR67_TRIA4|nr:hypothetical protein M441DRAFT_180171 [Trichoderma asperellum CBS 433.97]PTB35065.1 hypothetical protein M441DRAFT_180171 [Trichoderma asperellum CBS 433.97]UKZ91424.1 hypothetical protein TrAFT101_006402 [Trichoderma asperellum]
MGTSRLVTVFGATGAQGSGIINTVLSSVDLKAKYRLRAVTRSPDSAKALVYKENGVEVVWGDLNDVESLKTAVKGSYGVFGMTDYWSIHSQDIEMQQGKNLFEAVKTEGVRHYIWSSLPWAEKLTGGRLTQLPYFDGKAIVEAHIEENKENMIVSYFMPAMFFSFIENLIRGGQNNDPHLTLPVSSDSALWPFIDPPRDGGKYIMGLFEAGSKSNGVRVNAVSCWTTPRELVATLSKEGGKNVALKTISPEVFAKDFPDNISGQLTETLIMAIEHGVYGRGEKENQDHHDKWLVAGSDRKITLQEWIQQNGPWTFETRSFFDNLAAQKANGLAENGH